MTSPTTEEKMAIASPPTVHTTRIREKPSIDTLASHTSHTFSPLSPGVSRPSDVSTPTATANPFDTDVEAMVPAVTTSTRTTVCGSGGRNASKLGSNGNQNCQVWPTQGFWKTKAKAAKRKNHSCNCLAGLSARNRMIVKILFVLFVVAAAIGIGFGISKPLGASIWRPSRK